MCAFLRGTQAHGVELWARVPEADRQALTSRLGVARVGECLLVRASARPERGTGAAPHAYVELDRWLRAIRLPSVVDDWSTAGLDPWLRRLEGCGEGHASGG